MTAVEPRLHASGGKVPAVVIENDGQNERSPEIRPAEDPDSLCAEEIIGRIRNAGVVDAETAEPPVWWKISHGIGRVDTVIVNGTESEPYLTADHRTMLERPEQIVGGCRILARLFRLDQVIIGVEVNKKNGIAALKRVIAEQRAPVIVTPLESRYPQGSDKQLCQAVTGRQIPPGAPPEEIGCAVFDVQSVCGIYRAVTEAAFVQCVQRHKGSHYAAFAIHNAGAVNILVIPAHRRAAEQAHRMHGINMTGKHHRFFFSRGVEGNTDWISCIGQFQHFHIPAPLPGKAHKIAADSIHARFIRSGTFQIANILPNRKIEGVTFLDGFQKLFLQHRRHLFFMDDLIISRWSVIIK